MRGRLNGSESATGSGFVKTRQSLNQQYRTRLHKRLATHQQQLLDLQQTKHIAKKVITAMEKAGLPEDLETAVKNTENLLKKQLRQQEAKVGLSVRN